MCLTENNLIQINKFLKKNPNVKMTSNLVLRVNSLFNKFSRKFLHLKLFILRQIIIGAESINYMVGDLH